MESEIAKVFVEHVRLKLRDDYLPKVQKCVGLLSEDDLWWRPNEQSNSVGNILLHLCGNMRQWMIHGIGGEDDQRNRPQEFAEKGPIPKAELLAKLENTLQQVDRILADFDLKKILDQQTVQGYDERYLTMIFHVTEHFAQHLGQISYITKMRKNVNLHYFNLSGERGLPVNE